VLTPVWQSQRQREREREESSFLSLLKVAVIPAWGRGLYIFDLVAFQMIRVSICEIKVSTCEFRGHKH
jgi:hypothetical protein